MKVYTIFNVVDTRWKKLKHLAQMARIQKARFNDVELIKELRYA